MSFNIPIYQPSLEGNEKAYVNECLDSTWISSKGHFISEFETKFAEYTNVKYAASVCNGTVALHLALVCLGIGPGDEVIVPTLTYIASVNAITFTGATPVFVDSLEDTLQMDPKDIHQKLTNKTKAIMVVHLYGHPCEMDEICTIARENNLFIVEDCAEAFGSYYKDTHVGSFGDIATYSFFGNKTITTGEGGMVVTNNENLYERAVHYKGQGLKTNTEYWHDVLGYNYRMTNICAAIGLAQLERANELIKKKREIADLYQKGIEGLPLTFHAETPGVVHSFWMCSILVDKPKMREPLRKHLATAGIETRPFFYPIHTMPMYSSRHHGHPVAEGLGRRGINLPSWPGLSLEQVNFVCIEMKKYFLNSKGADKCLY